MTGKEAARKIDISAVRTHHSKKDIDLVIKEAKKYKFINVHVLPSWVKYAAEQLADYPEILVGAPVGFPDGAHKTAIKILEAEELLKDGVDEMDMVMNIGKLKSREYEYVLNEIVQIRAISRDIPLKVIIEINCLSDEEMLKACDLVLQGGADYIKTGTGWISGEANLNRLKTIKEYVGGKIKLKAAGGIRTQEEFLYLESIGIDRYGINLNTAIELVSAFDS